MAGTSQPPHYEQIAEVMHDMKRSAQDLLGEAPLTSLTSSPEVRAPNAPRCMFSSNTTRSHSTCSSSFDLPPAPSVLVEPASDGYHSLASHFFDTEHVLAVVRSYRSPSAFLDGGMVSDCLPPSKETRSRHSFKKPNESQRSDHSHLDVQRKKKLARSNRQEVPQKNEPRGTKRRAERDCPNDRDEIECSNETMHKSAKLSGRDGGRSEFRCVTKKGAASQSFRSEQSNERKEEAGENKVSHIQTEFPEMDESKDQRFDGWRGRKIEEKGMETLNRSGMSKSIGASRKVVQDGKLSFVGEKGNFLGIRSKPVTFTQSGQGKVLASSGAPLSAVVKLGGVQGNNTDLSSGKSTGAPSGQSARPSSSGVQSRLSSVSTAKAKQLEMYNLYKQAKERCTKSLDMKKHDSYEAAAKDCVRFYFEWALSLETELRLSEGGTRQGTSKEHANRRKHVAEVYRHMTNHLIPLRIRELEGINRHQPTHNFERIRQKAHIRLFYLQRVWNRDEQSSCDVLCKTISDACKEKQPGDKVQLTLGYEQVAGIRDILLQQQNSINIADQIVSDNGDGHEEAGGECKIC